MIFLFGFKKWEHSFGSIEIFEDLQHFQFPWATDKTFHDKSMETLRDTHNKQMINQNFTTKNPSTNQRNSLWHLTTPRMKRTRRNNICRHHLQQINRTNSIHYNIRIIYRVAYENFTLILYNEYIAHTWPKWMYWLSAGTAVLIRQFGVIFSF